jgi:1,4-alpha-glucan branching enzyme
MGEEWNTQRPFPFFCDFDRELGEQIREGRKREFSGFPAFREHDWNTLPDPLAEATFQSAKLDWDQAVANKDQVDWYRKILTVRRRFVLPLLCRILGNRASERIHGQGAFSVEWGDEGHPLLRVDANLSDCASAAISRPLQVVLWSEGASDGAAMGPWSVCWSIRGDWR